MRYLKANLDLNREVCGNVVVPVERAAYDWETTLWMPKEADLDLGNLGGTTLGPVQGPAALVGVLAVPLDTYAWAFGSHVSLIKIDAQGCDGAAILGLSQTIQRDHPVVVFEWEADLAVPHGYTLHVVRDHLATWGYQTHEWPSHPHNYVARWMP
jgi:FkbM family methyltransferase